MKAVSRAHGHTQHRDTTDTLNALLLLSEGTRSMRAGHAQLLIHRHYLYLGIQLPVFSVCKGWQEGWLCRIATLLPCVRAPQQQQNSTRCVSRLFAEPRHSCMCVQRVDTYLPAAHTWLHPLQPWLSGYQQKIDGGAELFSQLQSLVPPDRVCQSMCSMWLTFLPVFERLQHWENRRLARSNCNMSFSLLGSFACISVWMQLPDWAMNCLSCMLSLVPDCSRRRLHTAPAPQAVEGGSYTALPRSSHQSTRSQLLSAWTRTTKVPQPHPAAAGRTRRPTPCCCWWCCRRRLTPTAANS